MIERPLQTAQEMRAEVGTQESFVRSVKAVWWVTQPVMASWATLTRAVLSRQRLVGPIWYVPVTAIATAAVAATGGISSYLIGLDEAWMAAKTAARTTGILTVGETVAATVRDRWLAWLLYQLPLASAGGSLVGGLQAARLHRRRPDWRTDDEGSIELPATEADLASSRRAVERLMARMPEDPTPVRRPVGRRPPQTRFGDRRVRLGLDMTTGKPYELMCRELAMHVYLDGPTGFGKTTTLVRLLHGLVASPELRSHRVPVVFINMKPDADITRAIEQIATAGGRRMWRITHDGTGSARYNPLRLGTAHEIGAAVIAAEANAEGGAFTEPHHRRGGERYLQLVTTALDDLHRRDPRLWPRDYPRLADLMETSQMAKHAYLFSPDVAARWARYSAELQATPDLERSIAGLRQRIARAAESAAHPVLDDHGDPDGLVLERAIDAGDVVLFDLDAAADKAAAQLVGNLAVQDLVRTFARLGHRHWHRTGGAADGEPERFAMLVIDEFSALGGTIVRDLFQRSRSHGGSLLLSTQEAGSLDMADETFRETVVTNTNIQLLHRQTVNAEAFAGLYGTVRTMIESKQLFEERDLVSGTHVYASGQGNIREGEKYRISPNVLRRLGVGELMVSVRSRHVDPIAIVRVQPVRRPEPVVDAETAQHPVAVPAHATPLVEADPDLEAVDLDVDNEFEPGVVDVVGDPATPWRDQVEADADWPWPEQATFDTADVVAKADDHWPDNPYETRRPPLHNR